MVMGEKTNVKKVKMEINENPIYFDNFATKERNQEKWLGDQFHEEGLSKSIEASINSRIGRTKAAIFEVKSILEDFRMQKVGGLIGGFDIWEMAIVQSLLNNAQTWTDISEESIEVLEDLQNLFLNLILSSPKSTGKPALLWETGMLSMKIRIYKKKLSLINHIQDLENGCLAKQILNEQLKHKWPGLALECELICKELQLGNITKQYISKLEIMEAIKKKMKKELQEKMERMSKLKDLTHENFERKQYLENKVIIEARTMFRFKTRMYKCKMNFKHVQKFKEDMWMCDSCQSQVDTQSHVLFCPAYQQLRAGKDMFNSNDLTTYLVKVIQIREKLGFMK